MLYFQVSLAEKHWDPLFPFFWVVCHVCLPAQLGRHILLFWLAQYLHIRAAPPPEVKPSLGSQKLSLIQRHHVVIQLWFLKKKRTLKSSTNHKT